MIKNLVKKIFLKIKSSNEVAKILGVQFGKNCKFGSKNFGSEPYLIKIGDNFYSSSKVQFITHDGSVNVLRNLYPELHDIDYFSPIIIGNNVFIGYGAIILPGSIIEDNVIVGAGSIVKGFLKKNSVYAGNPAKYICSLEEYKEKNKKNFIHTKKLDFKTKKAVIKKWIRNQYPDF